MEHLIDHARFNGCLKIGGIDVKDSVEALHAERNPAFRGNGAAAQAGSGRRGRDGHLVFVGPAQHCGNLFGGSGLDHGQGKHA